MTGCDLVNLAPAHLDALMPFHLLVGNSGEVRQIGRSLSKILDEKQREARDVFDLLEFRRPVGVRSVEAFGSLISERVLVQLSDRPYGSMPAVVVDLQDDGYLINLSLGAQVVRVLQKEELLTKDFAPTDASVDMIYLLEVQSAVLQASRGLNTRLHGDKLRAEEQAFTDSLTGLGNRRALRRHILDLLDAEFSSEFALILIDLDYFKQVNDTFGHAAGDHVLKEIGKRLKSVARSTDVIARVGGDEFVMVLGQFKDDKALQALGERLISRLSYPVKMDENVYKIGASIGATIVNPSGDASPEKLLEKVDEALYHSKSIGRGQVTLYNSLPGDGGNGTQKL